MTVAVYAFVCGTLTVPSRFFAADAEGEMTVPIPAYIVVHERGTLAFDTGLNRLTHTNPSVYMPAEALSTRHFHFAPDQELPAQMRASGFEPDAITTIVNSHLHYDHCGGNGLFPQATVVVQRAEWEAANAAPSDSTAYLHADWDTGQGVQLLDGEHDLYGDGSLVLVPSYGHTPGHQSLVCHTTEGVLVLTADACYQRSTLTGDVLPGVVSDPEGFRASLADFRARENRGEQLVFGHDPQFWGAQRTGGEPLHPLQPISSLTRHFDTEGGSAMTTSQSPVATDYLPDAAAGRAPGRGRLEGRRIVVIGGGQRVFDAATDPVGNGRAISLLCAREGAEVVVVDMVPESAHDTAALIGAQGGTSHVVTGDVSDPEEAERVVQECHSAIGDFDGLVYNVGIGIGGLDLVGINVAEWDRTFAVNVRGAMLCLRAALPHIVAGGSAVLISTTASIRSASRLVAYESSKAALGGLMRHTAREASERQIRVNTVAPGLVDTPNGRTAGANRPDRGSSAIPLNRMATGWDIAHAVLFFLADDSSYITAQTLAVDGGRTGI